MGPRNNVSPVLNDPFGNIAIAFSGGGYRAAAFALGTLSYLEQLRVGDNHAIDHIHYSSSTSGGTITNLLFSASLRKNEVFIDFYRHTLELLSGDELLSNAFQILNDDAKWPKGRDGKRRNLINAFAKYYDQHFFSKDADGQMLSIEDSTMGVFWKNMQDADYEVCFNSTEFFRGLSFRFRTTGKPGPMGKIGNSYLFFDDDQMEAYKKVKLGDVLAASSCFPVGFEPMVYPDDFSYDGLTSHELSDVMFYTNYRLQTQRLSNPIAKTAEDDDPKQKMIIQQFSLMDGGITDNQGVKSMMDADLYRRENKLRPFDLMIVTDVTSYFMDNFETTELDEKTEWLKKNTDAYLRTYLPWIKFISPLQIIALLVTLGGFGVAALVAMPLWMLRTTSGIAGAGFLVFIAIALLKSGTVTGALLRNLAVFDFERWFTSIVPLKQSFTTSIINKLIHYLKFSKLNVLEQLLKNRLRSVLTMVLDVNLKQVRRLIFNLFWENPIWECRRQANFIYDLSSHNKESREDRLRKNYVCYKTYARKHFKFDAVELVKYDKELDDYLNCLLDGLDDLSHRAERARRMGTTLWFEENDEQRDMLKDIVITGQFTICANLLEYCFSLKAQRVLNTAADARVDQVIGQLMSDFDEFKDGADFLWLQLQDRAVRAKKHDQCFLIPKDVFKS